MTTWDSSEVGWEEYAVFVVVLIISTGIGIFYGCFGSKQNSTKEFLLADRNMSSIPVALSMICSAVSAITLLAYPLEVYLYGTQYFLVILSFIPFNLALAYIYIPVYFNLNVNSAYEFIEIRFNHAVRMCVSVLAVLHVITAMSVAIYTPALAIEQVVGININLTTFILYGVCIFYSTLGGLKAVLWTDVFQAGIMLISVAVIAAEGVSDVGGFSKIWDIADKTGRLEFFNFDPDLRTRHTIWTCIIGGYFFWLPNYAATQLQVQRFLSMPTMARVKRALIINCVGVFIIVSLCCFTGMVILAKFHDCDPLNMDDPLEKSDELVPYFVKNSVNNIPGMLGLFVAGLTCASMSSLSSGLTALASITTYDYISQIWPNIPDEKLSKISKLNTFLLGMVSYGFVYVVSFMGNILPIITSLGGIMLGPTLGLFSLGMMFPWANTQGCVTGLFSTFAIMTAYSAAGIIYSDDLPDQKIPLSTENCSAKSHVMEAAWIQEVRSDWKDTEYSAGINLLAMSYMWSMALGCALTVLLGALFSLGFRAYTNKKVRKVPHLCITPFILKLMERYVPNVVEELISYDKTFADGGDQDDIGEVVFKTQAITTELKEPRKEST